MTTDLRDFITALIRERPGRFAWVVAVQVAAGLVQVVGVLLLIPLLGAVGVGSASGVSRWTQHLFGDVGLRPTLATVLVIYVVVTAVSAALGGYQSVLSTRYRLEFVDHLRGRLYSAVAHAQWRHLMVLRQSDLLAALTTNVNWVGVGVLAALNIVVAGILVAAQLAAALRISPAMTGLAVASGIGLVVVVWPLVRRSRGLGAELVERTRGVLALATGFLDALKLIKAFGRERDHVEALNEAIAGARSAQISFARMSAVAGAVQGTLTAVLLGITVYVAVRVVRVPVSSLLVVAFVFTRVVAQIVSSQSNLHNVAQALPAYSQVTAVIAECQAAEEAMPAASEHGRERVMIGAGVTLEEVDFAYPGRGDGRTKALRGVSLELPATATVALAGPSGAGKTTVADLVAGLLAPTAGQVTVGGRPLTDGRLVGWRRSVALVPQEPFLFHDTIEANLRWARQDAEQCELWEALQLANAGGFVRALPRGLDTVVGDRGMRLSGGERQRLALARALLRDPQLLILDEATSSLDTENELAIRTALSSLRGRITILLIAHRLSTVSEADQIVVLDSGRVVETGSWEELAQLRAGRLQSLIKAGGRTTRGVGATA
jgi:ATP-binding cassette subfamily C protein